MNQKPHRFGFMHYCERCGMSMLEAVEHYRPCTVGENVRSLRNELAWAQCPARKALETVMREWAQ